MADPAPVAPRAAAVAAKPAEAAAPPSGKPAAVLIPHGLFAGAVGERQQAIKKTFAPVLGIKETYASVCAGQVFITGRASHAGRELLIPASREERYDWYVARHLGGGRYEATAERAAAWSDRADVVKFGYLAEQAAPPEPMPGLDFVP